MNLSDIKIRTRLTFGFGLIVLLSLASAGISLHKLSTIEGNLEDVITEHNVKIRLNHAMEQATHVVARVTRTVVLLEDKEEKVREEVKIAQARERYDKSWEALQKFSPGEIGVTRRAKIERAAAVARPLNNQVIELGLANKAAEATALLMKDAGPATAKWQEAIEENIAAQEAENQKQYEVAVSDFGQARSLLIGVGVLTLALAVLLGWLITRSIILQLGAEPGSAANLAQGVAGGDLSSHIDLRPGDTSSLMAQLKTMQTSLSSVVSNVRMNSESVATASAQIAQGNLDLSQRTEEQASALEETAASMEQLGSTVKQNADNARQANQLALNASTVAVKGGDVVSQVVTTMKGINDSSKKIADIISVIDGIAFQTNILALNAAVEAARAGEQGRGFAVVASEVRSLAGRSADAAKEIKSLINASVERVEQGTALVDQAGATMTEVVTAIKRVTDIMGEISAASIEQSAGVAQVGEAVSQMDQATQQNAALVEESAAAAESLKSQAQQLVQTVAVFKLTSGEPTSGSQASAPRPRLQVSVAPAPKPVERRGPNRATNVTRPAFGAQSLAVAGMADTPRQMSGTDDDWTSF